MGGLTGPLGDISELREPSPISNTRVGVGVLGLLRKCPARRTTGGNWRKNFLRGGWVEIRAGPRGARSCSSDLPPSRGGQLTTLFSTQRVVFSVPVLSHRLRLWVPRNARCHGFSTCVLLLTLGLENSWLRGLCCAWRDVQQHWCSPLPRCQEHPRPCGNQKKKKSPDVAKCLLMGQKCPQLRSPAFYGEQ